jgi:hypothetical protein
MPGPGQTLGRRAGRVNLTTLPARRWGPPCVPRPQGPDSASPATASSYPVCDVHKPSSSRARGVRITAADPVAHSQR